jgi:ABC-2 type transport system ATP-binding protein
MTGAIDVDGLTKRFGETTAVDDLSFTVGEGELFGLLGPNGAGKSTLINVLCTLLGPTEGTASVNGHDVRRETGAVRDSIGVVFQEAALDEELTGAENLAFHARMYGLGRRERAERIDEVLALVDLEDVRDATVEEYSGGMKRRLEIARGLLHRPAVLFLDEPTLGLDAQTRRDTWEYIRRMNREGVTVVMTTHYMEEADQLCDRVAIVDEGRVVALDAPGALKESLGGDVITVDLDGDPGAAVDRLRGAPWVRAVESTPSGLAVTLERGETRIPDVVRAIDRTDATITAIDHRKPTLEAVFLSLTGGSLRDGRDGRAVGNGRSLDGPRAEGPAGSAGAER